MYRKRDIKISRVEKTLTITIVLFFFAIFILSSYFYIYLFNLNDKLHIFPLLGLSLLTMFFSIYRYIQDIRIKKSFYFIFIFFVYLIANTYFNYFDYLKMILYILIFYIIGNYFNFVLLNLYNAFLVSKTLKKVFMIFSIFYFSLIVILLATLYWIYTPRIYPNIYLIENELNGAYQVAGYFISLIALIYSILFVYISLIKKHLNRNMSLISFILYILITIGYLFLAQIMGSNNGTMVLLVILFGTSTLYILIKLINSKEILINNFFLIKKLLFSSIISFFIILLCFLAIIKLFNLELYKFRIFGFGNNITILSSSSSESKIQLDPNIEVKIGLPVSLTSRLELLNNFFVQFKYSPFFGNMNVDTLTTGAGTYSHSFILSLLSHLGIVGFILFFIFIIYSFKEMRSIKSVNKYFDNIWIIYCTILLSGIFVISAVGTFFIFITIWFLLGIVFCPIKINNSKYFNHNTIF